MNRPSALIISAFLAMLLSAFAASDSVAETPEGTLTDNLKFDSDTSEVLALTNEILQKRADLERYYLRYRLRGSEEPKSRRMRYFYAQQTAALGFISANTLQVA